MGVTDESYRVLWFSSAGGSRDLLLQAARPRTRHAGSGAGYSDHRFVSVSVTLVDKNLNSYAANSRRSFDRHESSIHRYRTRFEFARADCCSSSRGWNHLHRRSEQVASVATSEKCRHKQAVMKSGRKTDLTLPPLENPLGYDEIVRIARA